jgi:hypothetical protein
MGVSPGGIFLSMGLPTGYGLECAKAIAESPLRYPTWRHARSRWIGQDGYGAATFHEDLRKFG